RTLALMPDHANFVLDYAFEHPGFDPRPLFPRRSEPSTQVGVRALFGSLREVGSDAVRATGFLNPLALLLAVIGALAAGAVSRRPAPLLDRRPGLLLAALVALNLLPTLASSHDHESPYLAASIAFTAPLVGRGGYLALERLLGRRARRAPHAILF